MGTNKDLMGVKMNKAIFIFLAALIFTLVSVESYATADMLVIDRADARVDGGRWRDISDGWLDFDLYPMDKVDIEVRIENLFDRTDGLRIRDIEAELYIDGMGSGSRGYIEDTARVTSISPGRRTTVTLRFEVPFDSYEGFHEGEIIVTGRDTNGTIHEDRIFFDLDVYRNYNELYFRTLRLSRTRLSCTNTRTDIEIDLYNIGRNDLDNVRINVISEELNIDRSESNIYLDSIEYDSRRSRFQRNFAVNIPEDAEPGFYYIDVVVYEGNSEFTRERLEIEVLECTRREPTEEPSDDSSGIIIIDPDDDLQIPPPIERPSREEPEEENDTLYLVLLVSLNVLMVMGIIVLLIVTKRTKRRSIFY